MLDWLVGRIDEDPMLTLKEMRTKLLNEFQNLENVDESTIARRLDGALITLKIATKDADVPENRNSLEVKEMRFEYAQWFMALPETEHIVYLDETGYNLWTRRTQGRSRRGTRVRRKVHTQRGANINVNFAISPTFGKLFLITYLLQLSVCLFYFHGLF